MPDWADELTNAGGVPAGGAYYVIFADDDKEYKSTERYVRLLHHAIVHLSALYPKLMERITLAN